MRRSKFSNDFRHQIKLSLLKLKEVQSLDEVLFWGRINGTFHVIKGIIKNYYIALGIRFKGCKEFPQKVLYWANSSFAFAPLPPVRNDFTSVAKNMCTFFTGEHEKVLQTLPHSDEAPIDPESEAIELPTGPVTKDFTELDRLSFVVNKIERDTHVIPQGAYKLTPIHEVRQNDLFQGLTKDDMVKIEMYQHFRSVETPDKKDQLARNEGILQTDVFDSLSSDRPKGAWSIRIKEGYIAVLRSFLWPGYTFYHIGTTKEFWGAYFGDGIMNKDLPFML